MFSLVEESDLARARDWEYSLTGKPSFGSFEILRGDHPFNSREVLRSKKSFLHFLLGQERYKDLLQFPRSRDNFPTLAFIGFLSVFLLIFFFRKIPFFSKILISY